MSIWDPKHFKTIFGHMCGEHGDLPTFRGWSLDTKKILVSFEKQTKNRNETVSNLSLGTRLTVLSKRLGRKCCCDTTPDRCLEVCRLTIFASHCNKMRRQIENKYTQR